MSRGKPQGLRNESIRAAAAGLSLSLCTSGCASLSPNGNFREVQTAVGNRSGHGVEWRGVSEADEKVDAQIAALLQGALDADEAVQITLLNNRALQATYEELGIAQADLVEAGLLRNPVFEAQYRWPGRPANPWQLHVTQDFIDIFFIPLRRRAAGAALEAAKLHVADAVLDHAVQARRAFYGFQAAEQLVDLRRNVVQATEASALLAQRQYDAGNISELDLANEHGLHQQAIVELELAQLAALEHREALNERMGLQGAQANAWTVEPRLAEPVGDDISPEGLESLAAASRLDLLAAQRRIESLAESLGLARSSALIPSLGVGAHVEREPDGPATWGPSVEFPLPIFNRGQPRVARAAAELRRSQQQYLALAVKVDAEVRSARSRMLSARRLVEQYKSVMIPLRSKIVEESQLHYNAMQIGPAQLLLAKQAELQAGAGYVEALQSYWVARADLERAVGGRLPSHERVGTEENTNNPTVAADTPQ